jgi:agmatine deiminase
MSCSGRVIFIAVILTCLLSVIVDSVERSSPMAAITFNEDIFNHDDQDRRMSSTAVLKYIQRGDWELPDVLLLVENEEWRGSLNKIISASHQDGIPVYILVDQEEYSEEVYETWTHEQDSGRILKVSYDTPWIRDYGPIQIKSSESTVHWLDFEYSPERPNDDSVPRKLAEHVGIPIEYGKYDLDGGAIISNGQGLCAITDKNLDEAYVDLTRPEELGAFRQLLGCDALAILPALTGESTGHADIIAQFLSQDAVAVSIVDQEVSYENAAELDRAVDALVSAAHSIGQRIRIIRLPMHVEGENYYSYVNGTRLKNTYLMPSFESVSTETEKMAYRLMQSVLHDVRLVPIPADSMVQSGGAVHCITLGLSFPRSIYANQYWVQQDKTYTLQAFLTFIKGTKFHSELR